jgi:hypothetical protein
MPKVMRCLGPLLMHVTLLIAAARALAGEVSHETGVLMAEKLAQRCRGEASQDQLRYRPSPRWNY